MTLDQLWQIIPGTLIIATPLILAALGGMFSEKSGIVNIGLEGIMTFSAFLTSLGILLAETYGIFGVSALLVGVLFGILGGVIFAFIHGLLTIVFDVNQIISGTAINILGLALSVFLTQVMFGAGETPAKNSYAVNIFDIPLFVFITIALIFVVKFIMDKTKWGLRIKACGENPKAAASVGIKVRLVRMQAVLMSGVFGALGGAALVILVSYNFSGTTVSGRGFIALAVLIFGGWKPLGILGAGLLFGFTTKLGITINTLGTGQMNIPLILSIVLIVVCVGIIYYNKKIKIINVLISLLIYIILLSMCYAKIPSVYFDILPYIITIIALVYYSKEQLAPAALGEVYDPSGR